MQGAISSIDIDQARSSIVFILLRAVNYLEKDARHALIVIILTAYYLYMHIGVILGLFN